MRPVPPMLTTCYAKSLIPAFAIDHKAPAATEHAPVITFQQFAERRFVGRFQLSVVGAPDNSLEQAVFTREIDKFVELQWLVIGEQFHQFSHVSTIHISRARDFG